VTEKTSAEPGYGGQTHEFRKGRERGVIIILNDRSEPYKRSKSRGGIRKRHDNLSRKSHAQDKKKLRRKEVGVGGLL